MAIDDKVFSVDFRDDISEGEALAMAKRLGLEVVQNCYTERNPSRELFVKGEGTIPEIGGMLASQPEVKAVYSEGRGHVSVRSPELTYHEMRRITTAETLTKMHSIVV